MSHCFDSLALNSFCTHSSTHKQVKYVCVSVHVCDWTQLDTGVWVFERCVTGYFLAFFTKLSNNRTSLYVCALCQTVNYSHMLHLVVPNIILRYDRFLTDDVIQNKPSRVVRKLLSRVVVNLRARNCCSCLQHEPQITAQFYCFTNHLLARAAGSQTYHPFVGNLLLTCLKMSLTHVNII